MLSLLNALVLCHAQSVDTDLAWKLAEGDSLRYRVTRSQRFECKAKSLDRGACLTTVEEFSLVVDGVAPDGVATVRVKLDSIHGKLADDDDDLSSEYDSRAEDALALGVFEGYAPYVGKSRRVAVTPQGRATLLDAPPKAEGGEEEDSTSWTWMCPDGARLAVAPKAATWSAEQVFPGTFALEHGLVTWPVTATIVAKPGGMAEQGGFKCVRVELEPRFALVMDDELLREMTKGHKVATGPAVGKGSMLFAREQGVLVRFAVSGKVAVRVEVAGDPGDPLALVIENSLEVELMERRGRAGK